MDKTKKAPNKNFGAKKIIIGIIISLLALSLLAFYFALPQIGANGKLKKINNILISGEYEYIVLSKPRPYESGTPDQVLYGYEEKISESDAIILKEEFIKAFASKKSAGYSTQTEGFWDMKATLFLRDGERLIFYIYEDGIYIADRYRRFDYICENDGLFDAVNAIRDRFYE